MNLYELAESLESWASDVYGGGKTITDAANMLRQQQVEIEALKKELETCKTIIALANIAWDKKFGKELHQ